MYLKVSFISSYLSSMLLFSLLSLGNLCTHAAATTRHGWPTGLALLVGLPSSDSGGVYVYSYEYSLLSMVP